MLESNGIMGLYDTVSCIFLNTLAVSKGAFTNGIIQIWGGGMQVS